MKNQIIKPTLIFILFLISLQFITGCTRDSEHGETSGHAEQAHWGYKGENGPSEWGDLSADYVLCAEGKQQSPINIAAGSTQDLPEIAFHYRPTELNIVNNGHTIQVNYAAGSSIEIGGAVYRLLQFHFHAPSEHTVDGKHSALEMHLVHQKSDGALGVVGIMINPGQTNEPFAGMIIFLGNAPHIGRYVSLNGRRQVFDFPFRNPPVEGREDIDRLSGPIFDLSILFKPSRQLLRRGDLLFQPTRRSLV